MPTPSVSVVLPTFHRPRFLRRAIESVRLQSCSDWELIIVDDNVDGTAEQLETRELVSEYGLDRRVRYLQHGVNRGGSAARNTGIRAARGKYVAFLDDDDEWRLDKLERQLAILGDRDEEDVVVYTGYTVVYTRDEREARVDVEPRHEGFILEELLARNVVGTTSTVMCTRRALNEVDLFDETLPASQDHDLYIRLAAQHVFVPVPSPLVISHRHSEQRITTNTTARIRGWEHLYRKHEGTYSAHPAARARYLRLVVRNCAKRGLWNQMRSVLTTARQHHPLDPEYLAYAALPAGSALALNGLRSIRSFARSYRPKSLD